MTAPPLLPLESTRLVFPVGPQTFSPLVAGTLGNTATSSDGFDAELAGVFSAVASDENTPAYLDTQNAALAFTAGKFAADNFTPISTALASFQKAGDALLKEYDKDSAVPGVTGGGGNPPGSPKPKTPPPTTPGGGGPPPPGPCSHYPEDALPVCDTTLP